MTDRAAKSSTYPNPGDLFFFGRWTLEEEKYAEALMEEFRVGSLTIGTGTKLRGFLAEKLCCLPKRVSKKYECTGYNGRQQYVRKVAAMNPDELKERAQRLEKLRETFEEKRAAKTGAKRQRKLNKARAAVSDRVKEGSVDARDPVPVFSEPRNVAGFFPAGMVLLGGAGAGYLGGNSFPSSLLNRTREDALTSALLAQSRQPGMPGATSVGSAGLTSALLAQSRQPGMPRATSVGSAGLMPSSHLGTTALDRVLGQRMTSLTTPLLGALSTGELLELNPLESVLQAEVARRSLSQIRGEFQRTEILQNIYARRNQLLARSISDCSAQRRTTEEESKRSDAWDGDGRGSLKRMRLI